MLEHLTNCHGEWNVILALVGSIPFIGAWLRFQLQRLRGKKISNEQ